MDEAVDQVMGRSSDEKGAEKAVAIRRSQQKERARLQSEIQAEQKTIAAVSEERAPIAAEVRKVEAEVGPIKYIAKFIYGEHGADENMLEKAVTWIIVLIVVVFDPLAVIMLLAAQMTFGWKREDSEPVKPASIDDFVPQPTEHIPNEETNDVINVEPTVTEVEEEPINELDKWNKMIEEAEKAVAQPDSTVEERVAKGETYITNEGTEVTLEADLPETEESKKKTYMIKNEQGQIQLKNRE
jgi:hypothetical protein